MEYKLKELTTKITKGTTPSNIGEDFSESGVMYFRSELLGKSKYIDKSEGLLYITEEVNNKLKRSQIEKNDILFSMAGIYLGKISLVGDDDYPANTNQAVAIIRLKPNVCNLDYLYYYMTQKWFTVYVNSRTAQAAQPNINLEQIGNLKVELPSIDIQNKVANILSQYDELIENNNKRIKLLEKMAENLYKEWFVRFRFPDHENTEFENGIPKGWEYVRFEDILSFDRGISYSSEEIDCDNGLNLINLKNIDSFGGFRRDGTKKYNGKYKETQVVKKGDLVIGVTDMTQDRRTVGAAALIPTIEGTSVISADLVKVTSDIPNIYLYCLCRFGFYSKYFSQFANGANVLHLKPGALLNKKLLLPTKDLIDAFVEKASTIIELIDELNLANDNLIKQRDLLLPRLMSGKLEV